MQQGKNQIEILSDPRTHSFDSDWYETASADHFWLRWRLSALQWQLSDLDILTEAPLKVLDVGGGAGVLRNQLETTTTWTVDCVDLDMIALKQAEPGRGKTLYYDIFDQREEFLNKYDVVVIFDVLEHIEDPRAFLSTALKYLKSGGRVFINVPAYQKLYSIYDKKVGHIRRYTIKSLRQEIGDQGLIDSDFRYWGFCLVPILVLRKFMFWILGGSDEVVKRGFRPPSQFLNFLLSKLGLIETRILSHPLMGTSVLFSGVKK